MRPTFFVTLTNSPQWKAWEKEVARRMESHSKKNSKVFTGCWDIVESLELGEISAEHFADFIKFTQKK